MSSGDLHGVCMKKTVLIFSLLLLGISSCVKPDGKSGGDAERYQAKPIQMGKAVADTVDYSGGDRTDWKVLTCTDPGILRIQLIVDNGNAEVVLELYNRYGKYLSRVTRLKDGPKQVMLLQEVTPGKYFIKVFARHKHDKTGYTLVTKIMGG